MKLLGRELTFNNNEIWHKGNFDPASKVDKVEFDNLEIGGRNLALIRDYSHDNQYQTVTKTDETFNGQPVYRAIKKTTGTPPTSIGDITIRKGETFTASIWIKHEQQPTIMAAQLIFYKNVSLKSVLAKDNYGEWERLIVTYTNNTDADIENVFIYFYPARGAGDVTYFTCPQIERGNKATDWTPAPEDIQAEIEKKADISVVPTKTSQLTNDSGFITSSASITGNAATATKLQTARTISLSGDVTGSANFDGSGNISINATVVDDSHVHDSRYYTESEIQNNDIRMRRLLVNANGVPTSNLGNPTVAEMALFEEQFNNKLAFYDISKFTFEVFDGTTWTDVTSSISTTDKKRLVGGDNTANIIIPNGATKYRITIRNNGRYVYINALYMYWSSAGNSSQIHIWKKRDDGNWVQHTNSSTLVSGWPGHLYLPFANIPWSTASTSGHYNDVRIEFTPTWKNANNITLNKLQLWGGYPVSKRRIYSIDENKNVTFPASVTATTFNGDLSGRVNGIKITVGTTAHSSPNVGDLWIDLN